MANPLIGRESLVFSRAGLFAVSSRLYGLFEPLRIAIFANNLAWGQHNLRLFGQISAAFRVRFRADGPLRGAIF